MCTMYSTTRMSSAPVYVHWTHCYFHYDSKSAFYHEIYSLKKSCLFKCGKQRSKLTNVFCVFMTSSGNLCFRFAVKRTQNDCRGSLVNNLEVVCARAKKKKKKKKKKKEKQKYKNNSLKRIFGTTVTEKSLSFVCAMIMKAMGVSFVRTFKY